MPTKQFAFVPDWKVLEWMRQREKETGQSIASQIRAAMRLYMAAMKKL